MGAVADIAESIGSAIGKIIGAIKNTISHIIKTISTVIGTVVSKLKSILHLAILPIKAIASSVYSALRDVIRLKILGAIGNAIRAVSSLYFNRLSLSGFLSSHIGAIGASISSFLSSWIGRVREFISGIIGFIRNVIAKIKPYIEAIVSKIRHVYEAVKGSIIGKILKTISKFIDIIETIHTIAMILHYIRQEKYFKAIYYAVINWDKKLAREINKLITYINDQVSGVYRSIRETYYLIRDDIAYIDGYTHRLEKVISDIGNAFGVSTIENIARGIRAFREEVLATAYSYLDEFTKKTREYVNIIAYPLNQLLWAMSLTEAEYNRYQLLFSYLTADAIDRYFLKKPTTFKIRIPAVVL